MRMRTVAVAVLTFVVGTGLGMWMEGRRGAALAQSAAPANGFAAVPGAIGSQDLTGPYEVAKGWPKDISTIPGNEKWTYGAGQGVFAESPNRVFMLFRGELPKMAQPKNTLLPQLGPSISFPVAGLWRDATTASLPGVGGTDQDTRKWLTAWEGKDDTIGIKGPPYRQLGVDAKWENCIVVADANGNIVERWTQWDKLLRRPHSVYISPYDPDKHVWIVDDNMQVIYKFTHDGKQLVQTIGTPEQEGADATHFNRPTFIDWLPDGTFFVSDGYTGTRVAKFDKNGKFLMDWGIKGNPPNETRPGYMNNVHGVAVDPVSRRVFVNDRNNHRVQVFDENGKFQYAWKIDADPSSLHLLYLGADRNIWTFDRSTHKLLKYDQQGHLLYAWGTLGMFPGALWGVHGMSVDQQGNLYVAEVDSGRVQKFVPKAGARPEFLVSKPVARVWN
jgi:DNA-binding beta-propeller fold protein YncE